MEPMTIAVTTLGTLLLKSACEGAGKKVGEQLAEKARELLSPQVLEKANKLLSLLHIKLPSTASAIEQAPEPPLDIAKAEVELNLASQNDRELDLAVQEVYELVKEDPKLTQAVVELIDELKSEPLGSQNFTNTIETVVNLAQGTNATIRIEQQNLNL